MCEASDANVTHIESSSRTPAGTSGRMGRVIEGPLDASKFKVFVALVWLTTTTLQ